jgi:hypothetical protein
MQVFFDGPRELQVPYLSKKDQRSSWCPGTVQNPLTNGGKAYHERKAIINPNVEKKNVLPYGLKGLRIGIDWAFLFVGLIAGAFQSKLTFILVVFSSDILSDGKM